MEEELASTVRLTVRPEDADTTGAKLVPTMAGVGKDEKEIVCGMPPRA
jgi:hypothetical protein